MYRENLKNNLMTDIIRQSGRQELRKRYRNIYIPDGIFLGMDRGGDDPIRIYCKNVIEHPHPERLKAYIPSQDTILRKDDPRWRQIYNIIMV